MALTKKVQQWMITRLSNDTYKIQNADFQLFASHDIRPDIDTAVLGKTDAKQWTIRASLGDGYTQVEVYRRRDQMAYNSTESHQRRVQMCSG